MIIGISGKAHCGKDTLVSIAKRLYGDRVERIAFADAVREEALEAGIWDGNVPYTPEGRTVLQEYGMRKRQQGINYWVRKTMYKIYAAPKKEAWLIPDVRFQNDAGAIKKAKGQVWRVVRLNKDGTYYQNGLTREQQLHSSETDLDYYEKFDKVIYNRDMHDYEWLVRKALIEVIGE